MTLQQLARSAALLLALCTGVAGALAERVDFTPVERQRILSLGPWPPPAVRDAGNAFAGRADTIALGRRLFFDPRLSIDGSRSCASCHVPALAFTDGRARAVGHDTLDRNSPTLWNAVHERWYGWDGAADSLWSQALRPLQDPREMGADLGHLSRVVAGDADLACRWRRSFGRAPTVDDERTLVELGKAIGAFIGSLVSAPTAFDRYRDALQRGDPKAAARYPAAAQRGLKLFVGRGRCQLCHGGPRLSNGEFADIGVPFFIRPGVVDPGRHAGILALGSSPYNLLSRWSDDPAGPASVKTRHVAAQHRNFGEFKVPSLRNVAETAPYMHAGQYATLAEVVQHYSTLNLDRLHADGEQILEPLQLAPAEAEDLVAFLRTLSDPAARRWQPPQTRRCR